MTLKTSLVPTHFLIPTKGAVHNGVDRFSFHRTAFCAA